MHTNPGTPSPEGNPIIRQIYKPGLATLSGTALEAHGTQPGNRRLVPIAPWTRMRIRARIEGEDGFLGLAYGDSKANVVGPRRRATQDLTFTGIPVDGEFFTLDGNVWTLLDTFAGFGQRDILIDLTSLQNTLDNIVSAINADPAGAGVVYVTGGKPDVTFTAERISGTVVRFTAVRGGPVGNSFTTTENIANATFGGATATGGVASDIEADGTLISAGTDFTVDIPNHNGEPWLIVDVGGIDAISDEVVVFEIAGDQNSVPQGDASPRGFPVVKGPIVGPGAASILGNFAGVATGEAINSHRVFKFLLSNNGPQVVATLEEASGAGRKIAEVVLAAGAEVTVDYGPFGQKLANGQGVDLSLPGGGNSVFCTATEYAVVGA